MIVYLFVCVFVLFSNIKPQEPYRAKLRYIIEKLENTLLRVREIKKRAGETTRPLLGSFTQRFSVLWIDSNKETERLEWNNISNNFTGQTLVGPSGYNLSSELQQDIDTMYTSLLEHEGCVLSLF
jgi:phosphoenolpyruvate carboxylase